MFPVESHEILYDYLEEELIIKEAFKKGWRVFNTKNTSEKNESIFLLENENSLASLIILSILSCFNYSAEDSIIEKIEKNKPLNDALHFNNALDQLDYALGLFVNKGDDITQEHKQHLIKYFYPIIECYKISINYTELIPNNITISQIPENEFYKFTVSETEAIEENFSLARNNKFIDVLHSWLTHNQNVSIVQSSDIYIKYLLGKASIFTSLFDVLQFRIMSSQQYKDWSNSNQILLNEPDLRLRFKLVNNEIFLYGKLIFHQLSGKPVLLTKDQCEFKEEHMFQPRYLHISFVYKFFINDCGNTAGKIVAITIATRYPEIQKLLCIHKKNNHEALSFLNELQKMNYYPSISCLLSVMQIYITSLKEQKINNYSYLFIISELSDIAKNVFLKLSDILNLESTIIAKSVNKELSRRIISSVCDPCFDPGHPILNSMINKKGLKKLLKEAMDLLQYPLPLNNKIYFYYRLYFIKLKNKITLLQAKIISHCPQINMLLINEFGIEASVILENRRKNIQKVLTENKIASKNELLQLDSAYIADEFFSLKKQFQTVNKIQIVRLLQKIMIFLANLADSINLYLGYIGEHNFTKVLLFDFKECDKEIALETHIKITPLGSYPNTIDLFKARRLALMLVQPSKTNNQLVVMGGSDDTCELLLPISTITQELEQTIHATLLQLLIFPFERIDFAAVNFGKKYTHLFKIVAFNYLHKLYEDMLQILSSNEFLLQPMRAVETKLNTKQHETFKIQNFIASFEKLLLFNEDLYIRMPDFIKHTEKASALLTQGAHLLSFSSKVSKNFAGGTFLSYIFPNSASLLVATATRKSSISSDLKTNLPADGNSAQDFNLPVESPSIVFAGRSEEMLYLEKLSKLAFVIYNEKKPIKHDTALDELTDEKHYPFSYPILSILYYLLSEQHDSTANNLFQQHEFFTQKLLEIIDGIDSLEYALTLFNKQFNSNSIIIKKLINCFQKIIFANKIMLNPYNAAFKNSNFFKSLLGFLQLSCSDKERQQIEQKFNLDISRSMISKVNRFLNRYSGDKAVGLLGLALKALTTQSIYYVCGQLHNLIQAIVLSRFEIEHMLDDNAIVLIQPAHNISISFQNDGISVSERLDYFSLQCKSAKLLSEIDVDGLQTQKQMLPFMRATISYHLFKENDMASCKINRIVVTPFHPTFQNIFAAYNINYCTSLTSVIRQFDRPIINIPALTLILKKLIKELEEQQIEYHAYYEYFHELSDQAKFVFLEQLKCLLPLSSRKNLILNFLERSNIETDFSYWLYPDNPILNAMLHTYNTLLDSQTPRPIFHSLKKILDTKRTVMCSMLEFYLTSSCLLRFWLPASYFLTNQANEKQKAIEINYFKKMKNDINTFLKRISSRFPDIPFFIIHPMNFDTPLLTRETFYQLSLLHILQRVYILLSLREVELERVLDDLLNNSYYKLSGRLVDFDMQKSLLLNIKTILESEDSIYLTHKLISTIPVSLSDDCIMVSDSESTDMPSSNSNDYPITATLFHHAPPKIRNLTRQLQRDKLRLFLMQANSTNSLFSCSCLNSDSDIVVTKNNSP